MVVNRKKRLDARMSAIKDVVNDNKGRWLKSFDVMLAANNILDNPGTRKYKMYKAHDAAYVLNLLGLEKNEIRVNGAMRTKRLMVWKLE